MRIITRELMRLLWEIVDYLNGDIAHINEIYRDSDFVKRGKNSEFPQDSSPRVRALEDAWLERPMPSGWSYFHGSLGRMPCTSRTSSIRT